MTFKELEHELKNEQLSEKEQLKKEILYKATFSLTSDIRSELMDKKILKKEVETFLKHKHFKDALLNAIIDILDQNKPHHLRKRELVLLFDENSSLEDRNGIVNKIHDGILECIQKNPNETNLKLQAILNYYISIRFENTTNVD